MYSLWYLRYTIWPEVDARVPLALQAEGLFDAAFDPALRTVYCYLNEQGPKYAV